MAYEKLKLQYEHLSFIEDPNMPKGLSGLYRDNVILINKHLTYYEKHCVLAEELGHYETTVGDITNLTEIRNRKLELVARTWGYEKIVSLDSLIDCFTKGYTTVDDICLHLEITPLYLHKAIEKYSQRYGISINHKGHQIFFDPLNIKKEFF